MKYSLIIPHFNDHNRLERLLNSVPINRQDIEVLVVDDCSSEIDLLFPIKKKWPMIRWFSTSKNSGAGAARNIGLENALGDYLVFADSDDEFLPGAFDAFNLHLETNDQLIYFLSEGVQEIDGKKSNRAESLNKLCKNYLNSPSGKSLSRLQTGHVVPWAKVYCREFILSFNLKFDETPIGNDVAFNVLSAVQAERIRVVDEHVYRVFRRKDSLTTKEDIKTILLKLHIISAVNSQLKKLGDPSRMHAGSYLYRALLMGFRPFVEVLYETVSIGLLGPTLRRLSLFEFFCFAHRYSRNRKEQKRL